MTKVLVHPGQGESFTSDLQGEIVVVGRSSDADLQVDDKYLSRKHANLIFREGGWWIEDLGSRNGTKLNGSFVEEPNRLTAGDELRLCQSSIIFDADAAPVEPLVPSTDRAEPHTMFLSASELTRLSSPQLTASLDSVDELRRQAERLHLLNDIHRVLDQSMELDGVLDLILDRAFDTLSPGEALIYLKEPDGSYRRAAQRSAESVDADHLYSETLIREVAEKGMAALVTDTGIDPKTKEAQSILGLEILSLVAAPLLDASGSLGMIALTSKTGTGIFTNEDLELLVSLASIAAMRIRNVALAEKAAEEAAARGRLEEELNLARQIQEALLPSGLPDVEGYELYGGNVPSRGVSGDYYTVVERNGGDEFVLMVADVSGKGMAASLLTFSLEALAAGPIDNGQPADEICSRVCRRLYKRTLPAKYATLFLAVLDPQAHTLSFCNAGHNSGLLLSAKGEVRQLDSSGPPVGLMPEGTYSEQTVEMASEDLLVLYTDGITEASDPDDEEYGIDRLAKICKLRRQDDLDLLADAIQRDLDIFTRGVPYADDRTLLLIRRRPSPISIPPVWVATPEVSMGILYLMAHLTARSGYESLIDRLNRAPQGAPPSELLYAILKMLFSEKEAGLVALLPIKPFTAAKAAAVWKMPESETRNILENLAGRAILLDIEDRSGELHYVLPPPMAGFFEFSLMRVRGDLDQKVLSELFYQYITVEEDFVKALFTEGQTQLGRAFVQESALPADNRLQVLDYERASEVIKTARHRGVSMCYCRHKAEHAGHACDAEMNICMTFHRTGEALLRHGFAREMDVEEGLDLLQQAQEQNLVQFGENIQRQVNFICNCCGCCCEAMIAQRRFGLLNPIHTTNYLPEIDRELCNGCTKCVQACPVEAMGMVSANDPEHPKLRRAKLDEQMCLGCGVCVRNCSREAIQLRPRAERVITPINSVHRTVLMALERDKLQNLIFDNQALASHRAMAAILGAILKMPAIKQRLARRQMRSRYLDRVMGIAH